MKKINLKIKQKYLDLIKSGEKKFETRTMQSIEEKIGLEFDNDYELDMTLTSVDTGEVLRAHACLVDNIPVKHLHALKYLDEETQDYWKAMPISTYVIVYYIKQIKETTNEKTN